MAASEATQKTLIRLSHERVYSCVACRAHVATHDELVSKVRFTIALQSAQRAQYPGDDGLAPIFLRRHSRAATAGHSSSPTRAPLCAHG